MSVEDKIYRQLQREIDTRMPVGFPKSKDGLDIKLLKMLFTPKEAKIAMHLSALNESVSQIYQRVKFNGITITFKELEETLKILQEKGAITGDIIKKEYSLAQFAVGFFEYQVDKLTRDFAETAEKYMRETFYKEIHRKDRTSQMHTIPIEKSLTTEHYAGTYENVREIINKKKSFIAKINCVCRQTEDIRENPCKLSNTRRCCIMFGSNAENMVKNGNGEELKKEELFELLKTFQKEGFVLQPENNQDPSYLCVCCGCCCGVLKSAKQFPRPAEFYSSNFYAKANSELCNGCEVCFKRCQMEAIDMNNGKAVVNSERCIGCGNCVPYCGQKAMTLIKKKKIKVPPRSQEAMYTRILMEKKGTVASVGLGIKKLLGWKI